MRERDFNEAQAEKPGKTTATPRPLTNALQDFNEAQAEKPGKTTGLEREQGGFDATSMRPRRKSLGKLEARRVDGRGFETSMRPRRKSLGKHEVTKPSWAPPE